MQFDLIVIGSGPAGSAAACIAAQAGLRVALIDKYAFPREKLCGGGVTGRSMRYLDEIFALAPAPDLFLPSQQFRLTYAGQPVGHEHAAPVLHMTMRRDFDAALHAHAHAAGATVVAPARITAIDPEGPSVTLADGRCLRGRVLIGADGTNSAVARALYGRPFDPDKIGFGLEVELDRALTPDNTTEIDLGIANWGYGWLFPKNGSITLGVGGIHAKNPDMKGHFRRYLARHAPHLDADKIKCKGAFLPFGAYRKTPGRGAVLLAGDAAGLVDPITGEGIAWALKSGQFAGQAVVEALQTGDPTAALPAYLRRIRYIHAEIAAARRIRALIYARPIHAYFPRAVAANPSMTRAYLKLLAGEIDYADLGTRVLWRLTQRLGSAMFRRAA
ncbi:MAG: geranylgeranyl reductase family protein [Roseinatronobacter sp.]